MKSHRRPAFTLVELLVVIGIIAVLLGILLPALARAREAANTVKCAANMHSIGLGIAEYLADYRGAFPPSNYYKGLAFDSVTGQIPTQPVNGYVHWSSFLYARKDLIGTDAPFTSLTGWDAFKCPSLDNGGLPPANTFDGNNDAGLQNESPGQIDWQAPRLAYTVNEALCPRGIFQLFFDGRNNRRIYHFVKAAQIRHSGDTILATEIWGTQSTVTTASLIDGSTPVSASRRPVNGISALSGVPAESPYQLGYTSNFVFAAVTDLHTDPQVQVSPGTAVQSTLDWVGRNHGHKAYGNVAGDPRGGWDLRKSNFLYVDGHVETKHVTETLYPRSEWGEEFYSLDK